MHCSLGEDHTYDGVSQCYLILYGLQEVNKDRRDTPTLKIAETKALCEKIDHINQTINAMNQYVDHKSQIEADQMEDTHARIDQGIAQSTHGEEPTKLQGALHPALYE
eukprot:53513_1